MTRRPWTREEDLAVLYLKVEHGKELSQRHPAILALANSLNRSVDSIWMRKGNFDSLDPSVGGVGLRNAAKLTVDIWAEYSRNPEGVLSEARRSYWNFV